MSFFSSSLHVNNRVEAGIPETKGKSSPRRSVRATLLLTTLRPRGLYPSSKRKMESTQESGGGRGPVIRWQENACLWKTFITAIVSLQKNKKNRQAVTAFRKQETAHVQQEVLVRQRAVEGRQHFFFHFPNQHRVYCLLSINSNPSLTIWYHTYLWRVF